MKKRLTAVMTSIMAFVTVITLTTKSTFAETAYQGAPTGDHTNIVLPCILILVAVVLVILFFALGRRNKK